MGYDAMFFARISDDQKVAFRGSKDMEFNWNPSFPLEPNT